MKILRYIRHMDEAAYNVFENLTACSKSLILSGLVASVLVAVMALVAAIYIIFNGYTPMLSDIFGSFADRSAALPAVAMFACVISELSSKNTK